jgi:hypothetical protein
MRFPSEVCTLNVGLHAVLIRTWVALALANEQRNQFGLRYNDYERYRCVFIIFWHTLSL